MLFQADRLFASPVQRTSAWPPGLHVQTHLTGHQAWGRFGLAWADHNWPGAGWRWFFGAVLPHGGSEPKLMDTARCMNDLKLHKVAVQPVQGLIEGI